MPLVSLPFTVTLESRWFSNMPIFAPMAILPLISTPLAARKEPLHVRFAERGLHPLEDVRALPDGGHLLALGEAPARHLGIDTDRLRLKLGLLTAIAVGASVSLSGIIGFVGLIIPHMMRMAVGPGHRLLLPTSLLAGATFLILADVVARTAMSPAELPIGVVTAAIGAPFFLVVLRRSRGQI